MGWRYTAQPDTNALDLVRFRVGDTDINAPLLQDEEIEALLERASPAYAAADAALVLSARFARKVDRTIGRMQVASSQAAKAYRDLARSLRVQAAKEGGGVILTGASVAEKQGRELDTDRVPPSFTRRLHEQPGTTATPPITLPPQDLRY